MKKLMLFFTVICAGQLFGMEPEKLTPTMPETEDLTTNGGEWETLPQDVKELIKMALIRSGDNLEETVYNIVKFSLINKALNKMLNADDLEEFTKIVHMLADKFNDYPYYVAMYFKTPTEDKYILLAERLQSDVSRRKTLKKVKESIQEGADVKSGLPLLHNALNNKYIAAAMIQLLLDHSADPYLTFLNRTPLQLLNKLHQKERYDPEEYEKIKVLLEDAMQKYQK